MSVSSVLTIRIFFIKTIVLKFLAASASVCSSLVLISVSGFK